MPALLSIDIKIQFDMKMRPCAIYVQCICVLKCVRVDDRGKKQ